MNVQILADSLHPNKRHRFTTFLLKFPKVLLAELNTHRQLVRSVGSARAIPVSKYIKNCLNDPVIPKFTRNQPGMVGKADLSLEEFTKAETIWLEAVQSSIKFAKQLEHLNIHKQSTNRLLDYCSQVYVLLSGTEFQHFFNLRCDSNTQPEFKEIADTMYMLYTTNTPNLLNYGEWHIPFNRYIPSNCTWEECLKIAIARCARLSYQTHTNDYSIEDDIKLFNKLFKHMHFSPFEHVAKVVDNEQDIEIKTNVSIYPPITVKSYLPENLHDFLFLDSNNSETFSWSRQYAGFYTYRSQLEDGVVTI